MPRHPRLFVPRATYHVYCRVARGEYVFDSDEEAIECVDVLRRVRDLDGLTILAWCLMANHYHLVVTTGDIDLWRSMARLQATVARNFNRHHRYLGRLWQSRYRARVITTDEYFRQVVAYVHLATLALARYRLRTRDLADLLEKNRSTVTRWLNAGLKREREDDGVIRRLDTLDHVISTEPDHAPMRYVAP